VSIVEVLPGIALHPLDESAQPEFVFALIRYRDQQGTGWVYRTSSAPNREELLGALVTQVELLKRELANDWTE